MCCIVTCVTVSQVAHFATVVLEHGSCTPTIAECVSRRLPMYATVYCSAGYDEGQKGAFSIVENDGSFFAEQHTGDQDVPAHFFKLDAEHIVMSSSVN